MFLFPTWCILGTRLFRRAGFCLGRSGLSRFRKSCFLLCSRFIVSVLTKPRHPVPATDDRRSSKSHPCSTAHALGFAGRNAALEPRCLWRQRSRARGCAGDRQRWSARMKSPTRCPGRRPLAPHPGGMRVGRTSHHKQAAIAVKYLSTSRLCAAPAVPGVRPNRTCVD